MTAKRMWIPVGLAFFFLILVSCNRDQTITVSPADQVPQPVEPQKVSQPTTEIWDVSWIPQDTQPVASAVDHILQGTGLAGQGNTIIQYSKQYGVNPIFALAMFRKEASFAAPGTPAYANNNPGNIIATGGCKGLSKGTPCSGVYGEIGAAGRFGVYASMSDGIKAYFMLLSAEYKPGSRYDCEVVACVIKVYCPPSDNCDTATYIAQIAQWMEEYRSQLSSLPSILAPAPQQTLPSIEATIIAATTSPQTPSAQCAPVEDLSFNPPSSTTLGLTVQVHAKARSDNCFRAMRLKIDDNVVYELGSPEFTYDWNTSSYNPGNHTVRLEIAAQGDNDWSSPAVRESTYSLQPSATATFVTCVAPPIEELSFNPASATTVGTKINIHAKATWNTCFRSMRLKVDGNVVHELGSPEFTYEWNTSGVSAGGHTIRVEVAAQGDNNWSSPSTRNASYNLLPGPSPTPTSCVAPPIEDLSFNTGSQAHVGSTVNVHAKATWNSCFRSMRLKIDGNIVYELGSPEFNYSWNTSGYNAGDHTVRLEVAAQGDNGWSNPTVREANFSLQPGPSPTSVPCAAPPIEDLSSNPGSPATVGTTVNVHAKATWNSCFRSMRLKIDGNIVYELGSPEFTYGWNTSSYSIGNHIVRLEVAAQGDNSWSSPSVQESGYTLQAGSTPTPMPCTAPPIEDLSFSPGSPATVGTTVNIHAKATWNSCFRSMRLKVDDNIVYELGSPEFTYGWNTSGQDVGDHTIRLEVAAQGDNSWTSPSARDATYTLQYAAPSLGKPSLARPSNGALLPPGTDVTLQWNSVGGATEYLVEIWGGQYGSTHATPCSWTSGTSCHIGTMSPGNVLWCVKARDSSGNEGPWSDEWNFTPQ